MTKSEAVATLRRHRSKLEELGVRHLALFGSLVRGETHQASDVDVLVELDPDAGYFCLLDLQDYLERTLAVPRVDLVLRNSLLEDLRDEILREAVDVL